MSLDPVSQGRREDMEEDIYYHMEQVDVYDDLLGIAEDIVSSAFYMTKAEGYGFDSTEFDNYGLVLMQQQLQKIIDGSVVLWAKADSVLHKHQINNYSSEWIIVDVFPNQVDMDSFDE